jgi:hypothetical protein
VAARTGYCGLDRRREPLRGDEVRACWEDGAAPILPEPAIPGLLDLLTERAMPEPAAAEPFVPRAPVTPRPIPRSVTPAPSREWVEVEA